MFKDNTPLVTHSYPKHSKYKPSGVDWLGEVPQDWRLEKLKYVFQQKKETKNHQLAPGAISFGEVKIKSTDSIPEERRLTYQELLKGEFLVNPLNLNYDLKSLRIAKSNFDVVVSPGYFVMQILSGFNPDYYRFLLRVFDVQKMKTLGAGVRQTISYRDIANEALLVPQLPIQDKIANFLDAKTKEIEEAIKQKQRTIALLEEYKHSLIERTVTKGLDPSVPMKDSGVDWLGEVPEHWNIKRLKYVLKEIDNRSKDGEETLLSVSKYHGVIPKSELEARSGLAESLIGYKLVEVGDIVLNKMQAVNGLVGISEYNGLTSPDYSVYRSPETTTSAFLTRVMKTDIARQEFKRKVKGALQGYVRLYTDDLFSTYFAFPDKEELVRINEFLDHKTEEIQKAKTGIQTQIDHLKEYKDSLIESAVTGKIKVA